MPEYEFIWTNGVLVETVELPPPTGHRLRNRG